MAGFMRLQVWKEAYADFAAAQGGFAETLPVSDGHAAGLQQVSDIAPARWWARYSAPGYIDATETSGPYDTAEEAAREVFNMHGDDERGSDDRKELAAFLWQCRNGRRLEETEKVGTLG